MAQHVVSEVRHFQIVMLQLPNCNTVLVLKNGSAKCSSATLRGPSYPER
jgi:hypothetical protein